MRVVVCNKYFFLNGGTERYMRNVMGQLEARGHEAVPFSVAYAGSWDSPFAKYFLPPPGDPREIYFDNIRLRPGNLPTLLGRAIYSFEARRAVSRLLDAIGGADAAYVLNIYNFMSPSILDAFKERGIRTVVRLGDYHLQCANYKLLRDGKPCELCIRGAYHHGLRHRCVHGSLAASAVRVLAMYVQRLLGVYDSVHTFIAPCDFMRQRLIEGGFPARKLAVLRQPADPGLVMDAETPKTRTIIYFGRITEEKGLDLLIEAYQGAQCDADLLIVGRSYGNLGERLRALVRPELASRIRFKEYLPMDELSPLIAGALLSVQPSRYYDNAPQAVVESYLHGTPVLGARIGGIPEEIVPGVTGDVFEPHSVPALAAKLREMFSDIPRLERMGRQAREFARDNRSFEAHMLKLLPLFEGKNATS